MRIVPLIILFFVLFLSKQEKKAPHGPAFQIACNTCHSSKGWMLDKEIYSFNHSATRLPLVGQHKEINCKLCHPTLIFSEAKTECNQCHTDVHQATVGADCSRCHTPASWLVSNVNQIHERSRFPLLGAHRTADCYDCHKSESLARFDVIGVNCIDCHRADYDATASPKHSQAGFSEDCSVCHPINSFQWAGAGFNHNFFALTLGHSTPACTDCHTSGNYSSTPTDCYACHTADYNNTINPKHTTLGFSTVCTQCHTTNPDWKPAAFTQHDAQSFPIYSGRHKGTWSSCTECHPNTSNYAQFTCISCHEHNKASMDSKHNGESGYTYDSAACFRCHPKGNAD